MAASKYALIMQMELVWPSGLGFQIRIGILTLIPFLAMRMPALTRALISVDFTFFPLHFFLHLHRLRFISVALFNSWISFCCETNC